MNTRGQASGEAGVGPGAGLGITAPLRRVPTASVSVILPFHKGLWQLEQSLSAVRASMPAAEVLIAADGALEDCGALAARHAASVLRVDGPLGPASARNRAAIVATGEILVFVDSDVVVAHDAIPHLCDVLAERAELAGVFGAYDEAPAEPSFMSRYKNLSHSYIHQRASGRALTFWAGLGAVRAEAFRRVGGFNEGFRRPSVEDIELGYRLVGAGYALAVDPAARGCHLKRWTLAGSILSDVRDRGIPWTQLILRNRALANDLNTTSALRWSVVLAYVFLCAAVGALLAPGLGLLAVLALGGLIVLNAPYYRWFQARQGTWFAVRVFGVHVLHHLCNGVSLVVGSLVWMAGTLGWTLPGRVPPPEALSGPEAKISRGPVARA